MPAAPDAAEYRPATDLGAPVSNLLDRAVKETHEEDSTVRNLCLVWPDGRRAFFNYAYLVAADLTLHETTNRLLLSFGAYTVTLRGYHLADLFLALLEHKPKTITAIHTRYSVDVNGKKPVVIGMVVKSE